MAPQGGGSQGHEGRRQQGLPIPLGGADVVDDGTKGRHHVRQEGEEGA